MTGRREQRREPGRFAGLTPLGGGGGEGGVPVKQGKKTGGGQKTNRTRGSKKPKKKCWRPTLSFSRQKKNDLGEKKRNPWEKAGNRRSFTIHVFHGVNDAGGGGGRTQ